MSAATPRIVRGNFLRSLQHARTLVPFPWLYFAEQRPLEWDKERGVAFHRTTFAFRVTNEFLARVDFCPVQAGSAASEPQDGELSGDRHAALFSPAVLVARDLSYAYKAIQNFQRLLSIRQALERIWYHCFDEEGVRVRSREMATLLAEVVERMDAPLLHEKRRHSFHAFELGPFQSVALAQPFSAEFIEPCYFFRVAGSTEEVIVHAYSGEVRIR